MINDENEMLRILESYIADAGSAKAYAQSIGLSEQFLCDVRQKRRKITERLAHAMGFEVIIGYRQIVTEKPFRALDYPLNKKARETPHSFLADPRGRGYTGCYYRYCNLPADHPIHRKPE